MRRPLAVAALAAALVLSGTACFSNDDGGAVGAGSGPATAGLGAQVPASVRARGTLRAGVVPGRPPLAAAEPSAAGPAGADVDLITQVASSLGLRLEVVSESDLTVATTDLTSDKIDVAFTGKTSGAASAGAGTTDVGYLAGPGGQVLLETQTGPSSLGKAVAAALTAMIADRRYEAILQRWGLASRALTTITLNGAPA